MANGHLGKYFTAANLLLPLLNLLTSPAPGPEGLYTVWLDLGSLNFTHPQHRKRLLAGNKQKSLKKYLKPK